MAQSKTTAWGQTIQNELGLSMEYHGKRKGPGKRLTRSAIEKKDRRLQAKRKWRDLSGDDLLQHKFEARLERLELTNSSDSLVDDFLGGGREDDREDYSVDPDSASSESDVDSDFDDMEDDETYKKSRKKSAKGNKKVKKVPSRQKGKTESTVRDEKKREARGESKRKTVVSQKEKLGTKVKNRVRSLAEILIDENMKKLSACNSVEDLDSPDYITAAAPKSRYPPLKLCVISGLPSRYRDADTNLLFRNLRAYNQLKELPPQWYRATATTPYFDALREILEERAIKRKALALASIESSKLSQCQR